MCLCAESLTGMFHSVPACRVSDRMFHCVLVFRVSDRAVSQCGAEFLIELFHSVPACLQSI